MISSNLHYIIHYFPTKAFRLHYKCSLQPPATNEKTLYFVVLPFKIRKYFNFNSLFD